MTLSMTASRTSADQKAVEPVGEAKEDGDLRCCRRRSPRARRARPDGFTDRFGRRRLRRLYQRFSLDGAVHDHGAAVCEMVAVGVATGSPRDYSYERLREDTVRCTAWA